MGVAALAASAGPPGENGGDLTHPGRFRSSGSLPKNSDVSLFLVFLLALWLFKKMKRSTEIKSRLQAAVITAHEISTA